MANEINVFEMTNTALKSLYEAPKKSVKESVKRKKATKKEAVKRIPKFASSKIRIESLSFMKEADEEDFNFEPEDEVVVVIDPEMEEVPATEEEAEEAAEELVGNEICKCSVCGANYVCDCEETIEEDVDGEVQTVVVDGVCPVCGEEGTQIVVGEIVPVDGADDADEEEFVDDEEIVDDDGDVEITDDEFEFDDEGEIEEESCGKKKKEACSKEEGCDEEDEDEKKTQRKENVRRTVKSASMVAKKENASRKPMRKPTRKVMERKAMRRPMSKRVAERTVKPTREFKLDEAKLSTLFTKFAKENYSNVSAIRFTKGSLKNGKLTLEGVVRTVKGSKRPIKLVAENFKKTDKRVRFVEYGPFTESVKTKGASFVVECTYRAGVVTPTSLRYNFKAVDAKETVKRPVKESKIRRPMKRTSTMKEMFEVKGIVK